MNTPNRLGGELPRPPKFRSKEHQREYIKKVLTATCHIFSDYGFNDGIGGYIVYRDCIDTDTYWVNPMGVDLSEVAIDNLIRVNWDGDVIEGNYPASRPAWASFTVIAKVRPEINAAVHFHTLYGSTWSAYGKSIDMVTEDSAAFYNNLSVFEEFERAIISREDGLAVASCLGQNNSIILQNHGIYTVGRSLDEAAWRFIALENACRAQIMIESMRSSGLSPKPLSENALITSAKIMGTDYASWLQYQPILKKYLKDEYECT